MAIAAPFRSAILAIAFLRTKNVCVSVTLQLGIVVGEKPAHIDRL